MFERGEKLVDLVDDSHYQHRPPRETIARQYLYL